MKEDIRLTHSQLNKLLLIQQKIKNRWNMIHFWLKSATMHTHIHICIWRQTVYPPAGNLEEANPDVFKLRKEMEFGARPPKGHISLSLSALLKSKCSGTLFPLIALLFRQCQFCASAWRLCQQDVKGPRRSCCLVLEKGPKALVYYCRHPKDRCFRLRGVMENNRTLDS